MLVVLGSLLSVLCVPSILVLHKDPLFKKKKGVTRVAHAATLQLNPAMEGYSQYEKGNHQDKPHP
jgi:hypothetical protein